MSNINIKSDMGGGNPLNIIRVPSMNEVKNISIGSDLNGSITPSDTKVWQVNPSDLMWTQNNINTEAYVLGLETHEYSTDKSAISIYIIGSGDYPIYFSPVIEYRE